MPYLSKINETKFSIHLHDLPWAEVSRMRDIDDKVECFNSLVSNLFNYHASLKRTKVSSKKAPWITDYIKLMMSLRDAILSRPRGSKIESYRDYYKSLEREKPAYFGFYFNTSKEKPKKMWDHIKCIMPIGGSLAVNYEYASTPSK